jgi:Fe-S-cluster containining protein
MRPPRPPIPVTLLPDGRAKLPPGNPCVGCDHCCRYVSLEIDRPRTKADFEHIRWYVLHRNVSVLADWEGNWFIQFDTPCDWLAEGRCSHYRFRPDICREYDPAECERYIPAPAEKILLRNEHDLERYLAERKARARARRRRDGAGSRRAARGSSRAAR